MESRDALSGPVGVAAAGHQYLTFVLGQEEYGVEILKVQEIKGYSLITPIPNTPPHVKGVMNLRGTIIPVVDLRMKLGMAEAQCTPFTVIVVVKVGSKTVGIVMDAVSDVLDISQDDIQETPDFGAKVDTRIISGLAKVGDRLIVLLDLDTVLRGEVFGAPADREGDSRPSAASAREDGRQSWARSVGN